jgi:transcription antitermination factor NusG
VRLTRRADAATPGDDARSSVSAPELAAWYVVYSKAHKEATAQFHLRAKGIEVFYPQLLLPRYAPTRRRFVPLFPSYLFVRIVLRERFCDVLWSPGVKRLVGSGRVPTPLDETGVAFLQRNATSEGVLEARPDLEVGQEVEISGGPLAGLAGMIQRPPNARGRVRVLALLLSRWVVSVDVPVQYVKSGWSPSRVAQAGDRQQ